MDLSGAAADEKKKKRVSSDHEEDISQPKRSCPSLPLPLPTIGFEAEYITEVEPLFAELLPPIQHLFQRAVPESLFAELWPQIEHLFRKVVPERFVADFRRQIVPFISKIVNEEVRSSIQSHIHFLLPLLLLSQKIEIGKEVTAGSGTLKFKLCFYNQIASTIFTNNEIKAENGEPLKVAICNVTNSNAIICMGPLSSAQIELVILDGDFSSGQRYDETNWTLTDFNTSVQSPRDGRRPLIIGTGLKLYLGNGVGFVHNLIVTDNSSWMKSKKFRLGAKVIDEKLLGEFPRIGEAVSQPFRVMDHRGEVNKKHHPPSREDEVWRLEGIGKDGAYHKNLSNQGIKTVGDFLNAYYENPASLKTLLGNRVSDKTWKMMVSNAKECGLAPTYNQTSFELPSLGENRVMEGETFEEQKNLDEGNQLPKICSVEELLSMISFEVADSVPQPLPTYGDVSTPYEVKNTGNIRH